MPRLTPISDKSAVAPEHHAVVDAVQKVFGNVRGPFSMLLHSPRLAEKLLPLVLFFREESVVDANLRLVKVSTRDGITTTYRAGQEIPLRVLGDGVLKVDDVFS